MKSNTPQRSQRSMRMLKSDATCWDVYVLENKEMFLSAAVQLFPIVSPCSFATYHSPSGVVSIFCPSRKPWNTTVKSTREPYTHENNWVVLQPIYKQWAGCPSSQSCKTSNINQRNGVVTSENPGTRPQVLYNSLHNRQTLPHSKQTITFLKSTKNHVAIVPLGCPIKNNISLLPCFCFNVELRQAGPRRGGS